jgi:hypothetical protein
MVQRDDSMDYYMCFTLSFSQCKTKCVRVFNIKVQEKSSLNC